MDYPGESPLSSLPNELFTSILDYFYSHELLRWSSVSTRFYRVIVHILNQRLLTAGKLNPYKLMLDCSPPAFESPTILAVNKCTCVYAQALIADRPEDAEEQQTPSVPSSRRGDDPIAGLGRLRDMYTGFRVVRNRHALRLGQVLQAKISNIMGDDAILEMDTGSDSDTGSNGSAGHGGKTPYGTSSTETRLRVLLDNDDPFTQLCVGLQLYDRHNFTVGEKLSTGVIRIWKEWADAQYAEKEVAFASMDNTPEINPRQSQVRGPSTFCDNDITWVGTSPEVGLRFHVCEKHIISPGDLTASPIYLDRETTTYNTIEVDEVLIRSTSLLLALEKADEDRDTQNTIIYGRLSPRIVPF